MMAENFFYIIIIVGIFGIFVTMLYFELNENDQPIEPIDYSDKFERLETGIRNSAIDVCFSNGGQWLNKDNDLLWIDLYEGIEVSLCARAKT